MALTEQQQTSILQLVQAMFNATPGAVYLEDLSSQLSAGQSLANLAQSLAGSALFFGKNYAANLSSAQFADALVGDLVGDHASAVNKTLATDYIVNRMTAGVTPARANALKTL